VRKRRKEIGMTQVALTQAVYGYRTPTICHLESDWAKQRISIDRAAQIAGALDTTIDHLLKLGGEA
jgi:DNA-binding XRE family transcriptional regulator